MKLALGNRNSGNGEGLHVCILLADVLPAESFLDTGGRYIFNTQGALRLHPDWRTPGGAATCVPLHRDGVKRAQAGAKLLARVAVPRDGDRNRIAAAAP